VRFIVVDDDPLAVTEILQSAGVSATSETRDGFSKRCDVLLWSLDAPRFTFHGIRSLLDNSPRLMLLFNLDDCYLDASQDPSTLRSCEFLLTNWRTAICGWEIPFLECYESHCVSQHCLTMLPGYSLGDGLFPKPRCEGFLDPDPAIGPPNGTAQWHQDWFLFHNFIRYALPERGGFYVDVGSADPYFLSNTVMFDACLGWRGLCVEPNPGFVVGLEAFRSCAVAPNCVGEEGSELSFADDGSAETAAPVDGEGDFVATCHSLDTLLSAILPKGGVVDVLSVDVEHGEIETLETFPFADWDVRIVVVETNRDTAFRLDVNMVMNGYAKMALLGKDAVFVKEDYLARVLSARSTPGSVYPEMSKQYDERWVDFQRRFMTGNFKGDDRHF
jgi:hypothetical protein